MLQFPNNLDIDIMRGTVNMTGGLLQFPNNLDIDIMERNGYVDS